MVEVHSTTVKLEKPSYCFLVLNQPFVLPPTLEKIKVSSLWTQLGTPCDTALYERVGMDVLSTLGSMKISIGGW